MRSNLPVSGREIEVGENVSIVSDTDTSSHITYANREFIEISGYSAEELYGQPHNLVRHPDMPTEAFVDLWETIKAGKPWTGIVKNRAKSGDHYWVEANVTPIWKGGQITGYMSVRTKPTRAQIDAAELAYHQIRSGESPGLRIMRGQVSGRALGRAAGAFRNVSIAAKMWAIVFVKLAIVAAAALGMAEIVPQAPALMLALGVVALLAIAMGSFVHLGVLRPMRAAMRALEQVGQNNYQTRVDHQRDDELGLLFQAIQSMQVKLGFEMSDTRRHAQESQRIKIALDSVTTNVMIADHTNKIIYTNRAVERMLEIAESDLKKDLPSFDRMKLIGANIDVFHKNPAHQRNILAALKSTHRASIRVGGRTFALTVTPVSDANRERLGAVVEWVDRTNEVKVEEEIRSIVDGAANGDFSRRIEPADKQGFFRVLAESINRVLDATKQGLDEVTLVLSSLARGDLTASMKEGSTGIFGQLASDANSTNTQLSALVTQIREAVESISTASREIASGNTDLSSRTEEQASSLEETASSMEELTSTVSQNAESARQANQLALEASTVAEEGGAVVKQVIETMGGISDSSHKISEIISVIDGIAFQTNILALNAAVEAARAGEQGRGFAVVASEVRNLAQRSAAAAREIKLLITDSVERVQLGADLVGSAGRTMDAVVQSVRRVAHMINEISAASLEQSSGIEQVNQAINQMDQVTQQNAALVEQAAAAAESLQEQATSLVQAVSAFKTGRFARPQQFVERRGPHRATNVERIVAHDGVPIRTAPSAAEKRA